MTKLLHAFTLLFVFTSMSFAADDHHKGHAKHGTNCHESCKAQYPDINSAEHKECMEQCAKGDQK